MMGTIGLDKNDFSYWREIEENHDKCNFRKAVSYIWLPVQVFPFILPFLPQAHGYKQLEVQHGCMAA